MDFLNFKEPQVEISYTCIFQSLRIFIFTNSTDPDEMLKYLITSIQNEKGCGFQVNKWITLIKFNTIKSSQSILYIDGHRKVWKLRDPQTCSRSRKSSRHMCPLWKLKRLLLLRKSGRNSRQVC